MNEILFQKIKDDWWETRYAGKTYHESGIAMCLSAIGESHPEHYIDDPYEVEYALLDAHPGSTRIKSTWDEIHGIARRRVDEEVRALDSLRPGSDFSALGLAEAVVKPG